MWKIVLIDDDRRVLQGMKKAIPWEELEAEWAGEADDGKQGLALVRDVQPDIIITDIYMPVMNGLDMIEKLRADNYEGNIIILSGYSDFEYARKALRLHVDDYLSKPVTVQTLRNVLDKTIDRLEEQSLKKLEQEEMDRKLLMYEPFVRKEWVKSVVTGAFDRHVDHSTMLASLGDYWLNGNHRVLGIEIIRTERVANASIPGWHLFRFAVSNVIKEVLAEQWQESEFVELHSHHAAVLLHGRKEDKAEDIDDRAKELGEKLIRCVDTFLKINIQIGVGGLKCTWNEIADSTEEAFQALFTKQLALVPGLSLFGYQKDNARENGDAFSAKPAMRPIQFYQQVAHAMRHSQENQAIELIHGFMNGLSGQKDIPPSYVQLLGMELWAIFAYSLYDAGIMLDEMYPQIDPSQELAIITSPQQLSDWLTEKVKEICRSSTWNENIKHKQAVDFMIEYIHEHYAEDITLSDLAEKVFISRNYLSHIFKKATGEPFNQYLTKVRMEKAKGMILEGKHLIYEIAEKVGYKNVPYFSTLFKKVTGFNPTELLK